MMKTIEYKQRAYMVVVGDRETTELWWIFNKEDEALDYVSDLDTILEVEGRVVEVYLKEEVNFDVEQ